MLYRLKLLHCSILETFRWNEISILIFSGPYLYVIKLKTQTIYWNWLIKTLIITRLSSLGVGVSRTVMSVQREQITVQEVPRVQFQQQANFFQLTLQHQWFGFGDFVLVIWFREKDKSKERPSLQWKCFGWNTSGRKGAWGEKRTTRQQVTGNSLGKCWVLTRVCSIQISVGFTPSSWINYFYYISP